MADVVIGIVTYNSLDDIDACLQRIRTQAYSSFELVILDNASADGTADWVAEHWPEYRLIRSPQNLGFGKGHNQIIAATQSLYYMPLNPDVVLESNYLEEMVKVIDCEAGVGWAAGKLYLTPEGVDLTGEANRSMVYTAGHAVFKDGYAINIGVRREDSERYRQQREVFGANGAAPLYCRTMLESLQFTPGEYFDDGIFLYHEDVDLDWRARLLGWRCMFAPQAIGYHAQGKSGGAMVKSILYSLAATRYYAIFKHAFLWDLITYNIPTFLLHVSYMMVSNPSRGIATWRFVNARLGQIRRKRKWLASRRKITRAQLQAWYDWSAEQGQERSYGYLARFYRGVIQKRHIASG